MSTTNSNTGCREAGYYCDKCQYDEAEVWEKQELKQHLASCPSCRKYSERNQRLTQLCKKAKLARLTPEERDELKLFLKEKL